MKRKIMLTATIATLAAAPLAQADSLGDLAGNSPAITEGGNMNEVASNTDFTYETQSPRISNGVAEPDPVVIELSASEQALIAAAQGSNIETADGFAFGTITEVTYDAQGNPEMVVELFEDTKLPTDELVITALPSSVSVVGNQIILSTNLDELYLAATGNDLRDGRDRAYVTIM